MTRREFLRAMVAPVAMLAGVVVGTVAGDVIATEAPADRAYIERLREVVQPDGNGLRLGRIKSRIS